MTTTWTFSPQRPPWPLPGRDANLHDHSLTAEQEVMADCLAMLEAVHERMRDLEQAPPPGLDPDDVQGLRWMAGDLFDRLGAEADHPVTLAAEAAASG